MNQPFNVVPGAVQDLPGGRVDRRHHDAWWLCNRTLCCWNNVDRLEREDGRVFVIEYLLVPRRVRQQSVCAKMPMNEERFMSVLLLFMDVFRRSDGNPSHRGHKDISDQPASQHCGDPMRGRQAPQLKSL